MALYTIEKCSEPKVWMDGMLVDDFSEHGSLVQSRIRICIDFLIRDGNKDVPGFHDHPDEMWISENYRCIAEHCHNQGRLKILHHI